ncbi:MBL fold metallo-hydrolase [Candidatus Woesearchaeota archaeon]|nr:MAG: MBL fold metallo-hydrolase [Candidatus Woesearchaeota archaeon]
MLEGIHWLGHDSFRFDFNGKTIYLDPFNISGNDRADLILITHEHYDHCSVKDILPLSDENTVILITPDCQSKLRDFKGKVVLVEPGKSYNVEGVVVETVPAYNIDKPFHPRENGWVGYILNLGDRRVYHAGDTDKIPEMASLKNIDVALIPVSGTYVMTAEEAAQAVSMFMPKIAVPMHYGSIVGKESDAERFVRLSPVPSKVLEKE